jgi:hypothetical protein
MGHPNRKATGEEKAPATRVLTVDSMRAMVHRAGS